MKKTVCLVFAALTLCMSCTTIHAREPVPVIDNPHPEYSRPTVNAEINQDDGAEKSSHLFLRPWVVVDGGTSGTGTVTKTSDWGPSGGTPIYSFQVSATFDTSTQTKIVTVRDPVGEITVINDNATLSAETVTTTGNGTSKASATFSFLREHPMGKSETISVTVTCDYEGNTI